MQDTTDKPAINVCLLQPPGYIHAMALLEAAEYVAEKCRLAGHPVKLSKNRLHTSGLNIVFGSHIKPEDSVAYPPNTVIFNTEQLPEKSAWTNARYKACLDRHYVWDYSATNLAALRNDRVQCIDFYHVESLRRLPQERQPEHDLVFYGSINDRRRNIIARLRARGLSILTVFGLYGAERDALLGRARAVLNLHFYEAQIFQQIRAFYALSNGLPVLSENFPAASAPALYSEVVFTPGKEPFEDYAVRLLKQRESFEAESRRRTGLFRASVSDTAFTQALAATLADVSAGESTTAKPRRINLGSGSLYRPGHLNIDVNLSGHPDLVLDLSAPLPLPLATYSATHGEVVLADNAFDEILALNMLSRVGPLTQLMGNCLRLLKPGGRLVIQVPHELSTGAWQDPAHIRAFNENSWLYYTQWFWQLGWFEARFECTETGIQLSEFGKLLVEQGRPQPEVLRTPRAVESMQVVLTKCLTTPEERELAHSYSSALKTD